MHDDGYALYKWWLKKSQCAEKCQERQQLEEAISDLTNSSGYQDDALVNGESQPLVAVRKKTNKCDITLVPGDEMNIGDLVYVFDEYWICMELYTDEYGVTYGEIWMCNQILRFQNHSPEIITTYVIVDDGSYSKEVDKTVQMTNDHYTCYVSLNEQTKYLHVDKRLALDVLHDSEGKEILDVVKISWVDTRSGNYGKGSHLLTLRLDNDVYNPETDNMEEMICNYIAGESDEEHGDTPQGCLSISGRDNIQVGTTKTYSATVVFNDDNRQETVEKVDWDFDGLPSNAKVDKYDAECVIFIPLDQELIGYSFKIICRDPNGEYESGEKTVGVISIG